jgi:beta-lactamase regulating signal transducer with metallopeptidase domain
MDAGSIFTMALEDFSLVMIAFLGRQVFYSTILFGIVFVAVHLLKVKTPRWHYALMLLVVFRLIIPLSKYYPESP